MVFPVGSRRRACALARHRRLDRRWSSCWLWPSPRWRRSWRARRCSHCRRRRWRPPNRWPRIFDESEPEHSRRRPHQRAGPEPGRQRHYRALADKLRSDTADVSGVQDFISTPALAPVDGQQRQQGVLHGGDSEGTARLAAILAGLPTDHPDRQASHRRSGAHRACDGTGRHRRGHVDRRPPTTCT